MRNAEKSDASQRFINGPGYKWDDPRPSQPRDARSVARHNSALSSATSARTAEEVRIVAEIQRAMLMEMRRTPAAQQ